MKVFVSLFVSCVCVRWQDGCTSAYCGDNGILLQVMETNPMNPIRNIRVFMPGFENRKVPFHPWFLKNIRSYSIVRYMDFANTNNNPVSRWADRTLPSSASQSNGVAIEHMVDLANILGFSPWFCIPHLADDDYVKNFATLVKSTLRNDVQVLRYCCLRFFFFYSLLCIGVYRIF